MAQTPPHSPQAEARPAFPWWVLLGAVLLPALYLPTLGTPFDFIDDGNLVYPAPPMPFADRVALYCDKVAANYEHLGPFRPVLWLHWELAAEAFQGDAFAWRCARLIWCGLAAGMLLWLLRELRIAPVAALFAAAVAMWNPYRNEIWTSLTLAEGVAMPYALLALVCARRAARSPRPLVWDLVGAACVLAALGCKNTFAALIPAQAFLRFAADGMNLREGWRLHGRRALLLSLTLIAPVVHFVYFKTHWHPGQYTTEGVSLGQLGRMLSAVRGAVSLDFLGTGFALALLAVVVARRVKAGAGGGTWKTAAGGAFAEAFASYRAAVTGGALLLACGIGVYLPMGMVSGRYSMPAVWGLDILIGVLLSALAGVAASARLAPLAPVAGEGGRLAPRVGLGATQKTQASPSPSPSKTDSRSESATLFKTDSLRESATLLWQRVAWVALGAGLLAVTLANVGRQEKFAARARLLWQAVEWVERNAPPDARLAWVSGDSLKGALNVEEGIHFRWHLLARGRGDIRVGLYDEQGKPVERCELPPPDGEPDVRIAGVPEPPEGITWRVEQRYTSAYWMGRRHFACSVSRHRPGAEAQAAWLREQFLREFAPPLNQGLGEEPADALPPWMPRPEPPGRIEPLFPGNPNQLPFEIRRPPALPGLGGPTEDDR